MSRGQTMWYEGKKEGGGVARFAVHDVGLTAPCWRNTTRAMQWSWMFVGTCLYLRGLI
jgi:hypothetical protein